ncbi:MAG: peptide deformylase [Arenicella sp.]
MALLNVLVYPDSRLRKVATPVTEFNTELKKLADDMAQTMYDAPGIGLAATQVNVSKRVVVIDISEDQNELLTLVNPEIIEKDGEQVFDEGCLSVPDFYAEVTRANHIVVKAQDVTGKEFSIDTDELLAVCIQHEIDHLDGKVFVDYLSQAKRERVKKKMLKRKPS